MSNTIRRDALDIACDDFRSCPEDIQVKTIDLNKAYNEEWELHCHYAPAEALTYKVQGIIKDQQKITIPWATMADAIYNPLTDLSHALALGDTIELPNGTTLIVAFKPAQKEVE